MNSEPRRSLGNMSVGGLLKAVAARFSDREALLCSDTGRRFTFQQLNDRSNQLAHALMALPLERGSIVAFICSNRAEILEIYVALAKSGLTGLPLNYRLAPSELEALINAIGAVALICEARFGNVLGHLRSRCPALTQVIWIGDDAPELCQRYEDMLSESASDEPAVDIDDQAPYYFNLTSGTTGLPKSYVLTQYSSSALLSGVFALDGRQDDVGLVVFPAFGRVGFSSLLLAISMGARSVLVNFDVEKALRIIEEESVTFVWLVPTMAALLLQSPNLDSRKLGSLRGIGFVGSMLPGTLRDQAMARLCPHLYEGYGLQETGFLTISDPEDRRRAPESVGRPLMFAEVRVVDALGNTVAVGETGEIVGRSPNCITEYYQSPAKNAEAFRDGWFYTGDLGRFDANGYLYLCGRVKDMIISGGQNIHPAEIEATLLKLPGIADCAVFGLPDELWGESVAAAIVKADQSLTVECIQEVCREHLAGFKVPRQWFFQSDPLPRTPTGKVQKFLLVDRYASKKESSNTGP